MRGQRGHHQEPGLLGGQAEGSELRDLQRSQQAAEGEWRVGKGYRREPLGRQPPGSLGPTHLARWLPGEGALRPRPPPGGASSSPAPTRAAPSLVPFLTKDQQVCIPRGG